VKDKRRNTKEGMNKKVQWSVYSIMRYNMSNMFKSKLIERVQETPTDWSFRFTRPDGFEYKAGQYTVIRSSLMYPDARGNSRTCSLSSSPTEEYLQFTFTMRDSGFKKTLMEMPLETEVELFPIRGKMIIEEVSTNNCIMIAGGIGVAPYRGIIKYVYDHPEIDKKITLLYSDKTIPELCYKKEFDEITKNDSRISIRYTLTRHEIGQGNWDDRQGRIDKDFILSHVNDSENTRYMVCGPVEMVKDTMNFLTEIGVPKEWILAELFTGY
jgi:ferredoxin-NADP reductase